MSQKIKWILLSFAVNTVLMVVKFWAYFETHSNAILSDALETIINVVASGVAFYSIYISSRPSDDKHPYGHGKIEYFSSGFEGALIFAAGIFIIYEAVQRFFEPQPIEQLGLGTVLILFSVLVNGFLGISLIKEGKKSRSEALIADGKHLLADTYSGLVILLSFGLIFVTNQPIIDTFCSFILAAIIFYHGFKLMRNAVAALMDEQDPELLNFLVDLLNDHKKPEWIDVHNLRIQKYGSDLHIDCHLTLPFYWTLAQVHEYVHDFEQKIKQNTQGRVEVFIHSDPCLPACCSHCSIANCPSRTATFEKKVVWTAKNLALNQKHFTA